MALIKNKNADFGIVITYWSFDQINIYWDADEHKTAHLVIGGYRSADAKKVFKERAVQTFIYDFPNDGDFPFTKGGNSEEESYVWLLAKSQELEDDKLLREAERQVKIDNGEDVPPIEPIEERFAFFLDAVKDQLLI